MDAIPNYDLLQAIDPTKIKVPISERFAKLTLSSNKKQQEKCNGPKQQEELKKRQEKRDSVTRNISKQFDNVNQENKPELVKNPLLRSESSKETEHNNSEDAAADLTMEPLAVSDDDDGDDNLTHLDEDIQLLSQQIASMSMAAAVEPKTISLSSGSTANLSIFTDLISSESQRSSTSEANNIHIVHNIPINVREAVKQEAIHISDLQKTYEMTDDEDGEGEDEAESELEVITISDTSESYHEQEKNIMATSSLPSTTLTSENLSLPSLTDNKAERVAAFLRDVSIENRVMMDQGQIDFHDTIDQLLDNNEIDKIQETLAKSRRIATADTESMTPDGNEEVTPKSLIERAKRLKALEESAETKDTPKTRNIDQIVAKNIHRLANDETQDNTVMTETEGEYEIEKTPKIISNLKSPIKLSSPKHVKNPEKDVYTIANDETQCNTDYSMSEDTPKISTQIKKQTPNSRRLMDLETEDNTEISLTPKKHMDPCRLVNEDTVANSILTDFEKDLTQHSVVHNHSQDYKTPDKKSGNCSSVSIHSTPQSSADSGNNENSMGSVINSSNEFNATSAEHFITILETDDEDGQQETTEKNAYSDDKKLSNSFHREASSDDSESDGQMSQIQMSMGSINISAKINIKIHIPITTSTDSSEDEQNYGSDNQDNKRSTKESNRLPNVTTKNNEQEDAVHNDRSTDSKDQSVESDSSQIIANTEQEEAVDNDSSADSQDHSAQSDSPQPIANLEEAVDNDRSADSRHQSAESDSPQLIANQEEAIDNNCSADSKKQSVESDSPQKHCNQMQLKAPVEEIASSPNSSSEIVEDEKFLTEAEKILTQLYGKEWQTPDVIRTLKRTCQSGDKKVDNSKTTSSKTIGIKNSSAKKSGNKTIVEESMLDDFSIFRRNIVKTNMDSTRLVKPKSVMQNRTVSTEPRNRKKRAIHKEKSDSKPMPQTERKPTRRNAANKCRWRHLIDDSNSEGDNASDDDDADESWSDKSSEHDSDFEISPIPKVRKRNKNTIKRQGRSDKSDYLTKVLDKSKEGEIVYLNLTKEEVEVQDDIPESPAANHDVTFAKRLADILDSCRPEDKTKLPSSNKKTKRKLFTPNFGYDDYEVIPSKENERNAKENIEKTNKIYHDFEEILEDSGNKPFDSQGRPKKFDLINKRLESVKTGKPIFQLTPPSKKKEPSSSTKKKSDKNCNVKNDCENTPKTKSDDEAIFKTPLTVKSKAPSKTFKELYKTPNYKYSFLKSLDVAVSKTLCHPDALYFRDNYRIKKEDLTKILYDMYNDKLFDNKLDVPLKWNKKLLNTAGRCFNRKKLGIRSCSIELSDKVLTSADRLRCTLIHELCHAATWIYNGEGGHGSCWKEWARKANATFPEIPKIGVCHQYDIEYKYTYKCTLCGAKSHAHSKSKKVENIRCSYCHGAIEIFLNKKDKDGNVIPTPVKQPTGFAKYVKENYKKYKRDDLKHADVMKILSTEFASLKVDTD